LIVDPDCPTSAPGTRQAVRLVRLAPEAVARVAHLKVAPDQKAFTGSVLSAFRRAEPGVDLHGIWQDGRPVGFFKIDHCFPRRIGFARPGELGLRSFLIDRSLQGRGLGSAAVAALPAYLRAATPEASALVLTVHRSNPAAIACYLRGGFVMTGQIWPHGRAGPQHFMRLSLAAPS
jgi:RimJ/RimL family protein N-acetyltransferase